MSAPELQRVWEPLTVGDVEIPNRLMMSPHGLHYGIQGKATDRLVAYYEERAKGGSGLLGMNGTMGNRASLGSGIPTGMTAYDEASVPGFARVADAVHAHGAKIFCEVAVAGVNDTARTFIDDWHPVWGMSSHPSPAFGQVAAVMDQDYIDAIVADLAQSAANLQAAGIDGMELHAAHGFFFMQALSPVFNTRTDRYGGTPRKRCQIIIEVAEAIRARVGDRYPLGLRYSYDEFIGDAGITPELSDEYVDILCETGLLSHFDITAGSQFSLDHVVAPMGSHPEGFLVHYAARAKQVAGDRAKVFCVGRIRSVAQAEQILRDGSSDMVALTRAQIADPYLVRKAREGKPETTVRCVGANECIGAGNDPIACTVNPIVGRERAWATLPKADRPRRVAVIGAGPAGLRFAATASARGHEVDVYDRASEVGGHLALLRQIPTREDWGFAVEDLERMALEGGVRFHLGHEIDDKALAELPADIAIVATGARWERTGYTPVRPHLPVVPGTEADHVIDVATAAERVLADGSALGRRVVIADESNGFLPLGVAELLAAAGAEVTVVSRHLFIGSEVLGTVEGGIVFPRMAKAGIALRPQLLLDKVEGGNVHLSSIWGTGGEVIEDVDTVVLAMLRASDQDLYPAARQRFERALLVGDSLAPRNPTEVIYEAERTAREI